MPHRVLRRVLRAWIGSCCSPEDADRVADKLMEVGVRAPAITITEAADLDAIPDGSAVVVGNLLDGAARVGAKVAHAVLFAGEDEPYPFHLDGLPPPLPCTVIWLPKEGRTHFQALYAHRTAPLFGMDEQQLLAEYAADTE